MESSHGILAGGVLEENPRPKVSVTAITSSPSNAPAPAKV